MRLLTPPSSRQGASPATRDLSPGDKLRTSRTSPLSRSDFVPWHAPNLLHCICRLVACAVERRRFPVGVSPTRQPLQPEATGAVMEVTKWLKPLVSVSRYTVTARVCRP